MASSSTVSLLKSLLASLPITRGKLLKEQFKGSLELLAIDTPAKSIGTLAASLKAKNAMLDAPKVKSIVKSAKAGDRRLLLLNPSLQDPTAVLEGSLLERHSATVVAYSLHIDYDYWPVEDVLNCVLPEGLESVSSFETIGHIAHLNLTPEHLPYKEIIGQVILDKNPNIKTVLTKIGEIQNAYRVFDMAIIAGASDLSVQVSQNSCHFTFDYAKVYWNSRLEHEHERLVQLFKSSDAVCDVFAGVGPFSIPAAARKKAIVYANDLNPESFKYLNRNKQLNKIPEKRLLTFNMDGAKFIRHSFFMYNGLEETTFLSTIKESPKMLKFFDHYIMNLPASAPSFLEAFLMLANELGGASISQYPVVHCYLFARGEADPLDIIEAAMDHRVRLSGPASDLCELTNVRRVSPNKVMFCVSFRLPASLFAGGTAGPSSASSGNGHLHHGERDTLKRQRLPSPPSSPVNKTNAI